MKVLVIRLSPFSTQEITGVTSISYANHTYTVTTGSGSTTYSDSDYKISIAW